MRAEYQTISYMRKIYKKGNQLENCEETLHEVIKRILCRQKRKARTSTLNNLETVLVYYIHTASQV